VKCALCGREAELAVAWCPWWLSWLRRILEEFAIFPFSRAPEWLLMLMVGLVELLLYPALWLNRRWRFPVCDLCRIRVGYVDWETLPLSALKTDGNHLS